MGDAFICDAVRTPVGRYGGALSRIRPDDLAAHCLKVLAGRHPLVEWSQLDDVILGCANQAGEDNRNVARMAVLLAGLPVGVPADTVNRLCGSGLDAVSIAARAVKSGEADLLIAGGVESMSRAPFVLPKADSPFSRSAEIHDTTIGWRFVNRSLQAAWGAESMPETAENVAEQFGISRADQDAFALASQKKAAQAQSSGRLALEIVPVAVAHRGETVIVDKDEHPRPDTTISALEKLKGVVRPDGTVTAGNSSGINDGACVLLIASERAIKQYGLKPLARVVGVASAGVPPSIMGIGPAPATTRLLERLSLSLDHVDIIELNEAFASQALAVLHQLGLADDDPRVNPNGGAIALGHPLGMSGARLAATAVTQLQVTGGRFALCTMCIGVGQGIAALLERV